MKSKYQFWSTEQKQQLIQFTSTNKDINDKINWQSYTNQVADKTKIQCKSYFTNVLKNLQILQQPVFDKLVVDMIYYFMIYNGDMKKTREQFSQLDDNQFEQLNKQRQEVHISIVAQIPYILQYPDTNYKFNFEVLDISNKIMEQFPDCISNLYDKPNSKILVNKDEAQNVVSRIQRILLEQKYVMTTK
ncbi:Homeobox-like_domain superfamily [Hexamita inflata]|uniref:Homeobox-like domain superfamily n=1 Tax=Hexamita inflata TaxID=28002 RepID=A0AA86QJ81_9EUKA|nr:Homeobox-like domain superfamily [Hexamita inflata]CAI9955518.1 Homeobox-like domain superfamily [Hexamita inflata]